MRHFSSINFSFFKIYFDTGIPLGATYLGSLIVKYQFNIHIQIHQTDLHTIFKELVVRICYKINEFFLWRSFE